MTAKESDGKLVTQGGGSEAARQQSLQEARRVMHPVCFQHNVGVIFVMCLCLALKENQQNPPMLNENIPRLCGFDLLYR